MGIRVNNSSVWTAIVANKDALVALFVKLLGLWKRPRVFVNDGGTWKLVWGWDDITSYKYALKSKSVNAQDTYPAGITFSQDGTKMYMVGSTNGAVYQYTLSTAWDVSTATYASKSVSVAGEDVLPRGVTFSVDGTKMYMVGVTSRIVYQYNLTSAWDVSTATYTGKSFSVFAEELSPESVVFSPDGVAMYVLGYGDDTVYQYTLTTAWDVSTAAYASKSFSVTTEEITPRGLFFSADGTKMYMVGSFTDTVYQYTLTTAWDVSTAAYASKSLSVAVATAPHDLFFSDDGTYLYILDNATPTVYQYVLTTAWDVTTYQIPFISVAAEDVAPAAVFFNPDGTKMYVLGVGNDAVYQYTLTTAWDVSTATYASKSASVAGEEVAAHGLFFNTEGTKMYIVGITSDTVYQYTLTTAWDVSTATYASKSKSVAGEGVNPDALLFNSDGTKMYVIAEPITIFQYALGVAWDVSTAVYDDKSKRFAEIIYPRNSAFNPDGTKLYVLCAAEEGVFQYSLLTPWDVSTIIYDSKSLSVALEEDVPRGLFFKPDGTKMYITGSDSDKVHQYVAY